MSNEIQYEFVTPEELLKWIETNKPFYLIDTLKDDHFQKARLPEASNACVFEVGAKLKRERLAAAPFRIWN